MAIIGVHSLKSDIMANKRVVLAKIKELHRKIGGGNPEIPIGKIASQLQITNEEVNTTLQTLRKLSFISFKNADTIEITKIGLSK